MTTSVTSPGDLRSLADEDEDKLEPQRTTAHGVDGRADLYLSRGSAQFNHSQLKLEEICVCRAHASELNRNSPWENRCRSWIRTEEGRIKVFYCPINAAAVGGVSHGVNEVPATGWLSKQVSFLVNPNLAQEG